MGNQTDHADSDITGLRGVPGVIMHTLGELSSFRQFGNNPIIYLYLEQPAFPVMKIEKLSETSWRVRHAGVSILTIAACLEKSVKLDAIVVMQNGPHLKPIEAEIRRTCETSKAFLLLLNKPVNKAAYNYVKEPSTET